MIEPATASEFAADEIRIFSLLRDAGFRPNVIYDIGASNGTWSTLISQVFPDSTFHLFEPLAEVREDYSESLACQFKGHPQFTKHAVALGDCEKVIEMFVDQSGYGSTILNMSGHPDFRRRVNVQQYALDDYVRRHNLAWPDIIKIDTQGAEHLIFSHAPQCLAHARLVFAETWLTRGYGPATPLLGELMDLLAASGFVLTELGHRFYDARHGLYCCDAFFLQSDFLNHVVQAMPAGVW